MGKHRVLTYIAPSMKHSLYWLLLTATAFIVFQACNGNGTEPSEEPILSDPQSLFDDRDSTFYVAVTVTLPDVSALDTVWSELYLETGLLADSLGTDTLMRAVGLVDNGENGDILDADGVFARKFDSPLPSGTGGSVRFVFYALVAGDSSTVTDILKLASLRPVIFSVSVPDIMPLPRPEVEFTPGTIRAVVGDPDGLDDIREVRFTSLKPDSTPGNQGQPVFLADNGDELYGDLKEGDGIYSVIIKLLAVDDQGDSTQTGTYEFRFIARDRSGLSSNTVYKTVEVVESSLP